MMQFKGQWLLPLLAVGIASAQTAPTKVGIINIQGALVATKDGQKAAQELEARFAPKRKDIEKRQQNIQTLQAQLQKGGSVLSDEQKRKLMADIDQQTKSLNRDVEDAQGDLEQEQGKMLSELYQKMQVVIDKYAREKGFALILDVSSQQTPVLYAANEIEITKDIIELYDKSAPSAPPAPTGAFAPKPAAAPPPAALTPIPASKKK
jgi:outer membrane protein